MEKRRDGEGEGDSLRRREIHREEEIDGEGKRREICRERKGDGDGGEIEKRRRLVERWRR